MYALLQTITIKLKKLVLKCRFVCFFLCLLSTKFGYKFFHLAQNLAITFLRSDRPPGIAMACFNTSFFRPPLEFQGQINSITTFQVPVLLSIQKSPLQNVIGRLKRLTNMRS